MADDKKKSDDDDTEAAEGEEGAEGEGGGKKKLPLKMLLMIGVPVLVLVLGGGGTAAFFLMKPKAVDEKGAHGEKKDKKKKDGKDKKKEKGGHGKGKKEPGGPVIKEGPDGMMFYTLPNVLVNIQSTDGRPTYLKLKLTLEVPDAETLEILEPLMPRVTDLFTSFLRELRADDLTGAEGSMRLRLELLRRVNLALAPKAKINAVLIEEMLIQ